MNSPEVSPIEMDYKIGGLIYPISQVAVMDVNFNRTQSFDNEYLAEYNISVPTFFVANYLTKKIKTNPSDVFNSIGLESYFKQCVAKKNKTETCFASAPASLKKFMVELYHHEILLHWFSSKFLKIDTALPHFILCSCAEVELGKTKINFKGKGIHSED